MLHFLQTKMHFVEKKLLTYFNYYTICPIFAKSISKKTVEINNKKTQFHYFY